MLEVMDRPSDVGDNVATRQIRVLILHQNPLYRLGLRSTLGSCEGMIIVGEGIPLEQELDVLIIDGHFPNALSIVSCFHKAGTRSIMVLAPDRDEKSLFHFMMVGASAYELPTISCEDMIAKLRRIADGECIISGECLPEPAESVVVEPEPEYLPPDVDIVPVGKFITSKRELRTPARIHFNIPVTSQKITAREVRVLELIKDGYTNYQICQMLDIKYNNIKHILSRINHKFNVHDRTSAVMTAIQLGLLPLSA